ncbi:MAG: hypothetical protein KatS3mg088_769 [Patescibacteria group bacterium]|nr:MAG: hypothetical protein KatS3mg088_769 [Patescibacteria group bacterium]
MANIRKTIFADGEVYHIYNRGIEGNDIFTSKREYKRAILTLAYYLFSNQPFRLSKLLVLENQRRQGVLENMERNGERRVDIIAYCLMPNHFHFLLRQLKDGGVSGFVSDFTNSYTRYFNKRHNRVGPIFQGSFKAVHIDTNEQLLHVSRYIHINPAVSYLVKKEDLESYPWSSLPEYFGKMEAEICNKDLVLNQFKDANFYRDFVFAQIDYGRELEEMKHLEK